MTSLLPLQYVAPHSSIPASAAAESTSNTEQQLQQQQPNYQFQQQRWYSNASRMTRDGLTVSLPAGGAERVVPSVAVVKPRSSPNATATTTNRLAYVDALVDANAIVIELIWQLNPASDSSKLNNDNTNNAVVPLRTFIQEVLKRSRTTYSTLQTALFYLFRSRPEITNYLTRMQQQQQQQNNNNNWEYAYINCGRRMFLASLVVASKFVQDKTYRNSAWAKIAGLPVSEVNAAERIFLNLINYRLYIAQPKFEQWHHLLHMYVERKTLNQPADLHDLSSLPFAPTSADYFDHADRQLLPSPRTTPPRSQQNHGWTFVLSPTSFLPPPLNNSCECQPDKRSKKRKTSSASASYPPVLSMSLPSSINSSPMQTPTQISPVRMNNGTSVFNWNSPTSFDHNILHQRSILNPVGDSMSKKRKFAIIDSHPRSYNISNVRQQSNRFYP